LEGAVTKMNALVLCHSRITDGVTVRGDVAIKPPLATCYRVQQPVVGTGGYSVYCIVTAHETRNPALFHTVLERGHVTARNVYTTMHDKQCVLQ
jgi:hypothetical protein